MNYKIVLSPGANADIESVVRWYLNIDPNWLFASCGKTKKVCSELGDCHLRSQSELAHLVEYR